METFLDVSVAREWRDDTDKWILGYFWLPLVFGTLVLVAFGGGELFPIDIPTLVALFFLLYLTFPCLCNDDIKSEHAHNRHTREGGGEIECKVTALL